MSALTRGSDDDEEEERRQLRRQQNEEYEEALRQDQLTEQNDPTSSLRNEMRRLSIKKLPKGVKTLPQPLTVAKKKIVKDRIEKRVLKQTKGKILRKKFNHLKYGFMAPLCGKNGYMQPMFVEQHGELVNVLGEHTLNLDDEYDSDEEEIYDFDLYSLFKENGINRLIRMKKNSPDHHYLFYDDNMDYYDKRWVEKKKPKVSEKKKPVDSDSYSGWDSDSNNQTIDIKDNEEEEENPFEKIYYNDDSTDEEDMTEEERTKKEEKEKLEKEKNMQIELTRLKEKENITMTNLILPDELEQNGSNSIRIFTTCLDDCPSKTRLIPPYPHDGNTWTEEAEGKTLEKVRSWYGRIDEMHTKLNTKMTVAGKNSLTFRATFEKWKDKPGILADLINLREEYTYMLTSSGTYHDSKLFGEFKNDFKIFINTIKMKIDDLENEFVNNLSETQQKIYRQENSDEDTHDYKREAQKIFADLYEYVFQIDKINLIIDQAFETVKEKTTLQSRGKYLEKMQEARDPLTNRHGDQHTNRMGFIKADRTYRLFFGKFKNWVDNLKQTFRDCEVTVQDLYREFYMKGQHMDILSKSYAQKFLLPP